MTYTTKFNIGDSAWVMFHNKPKRAIIKAVKIKDTSLIRINNKPYMVHYEVSELLENGNTGLVISNELSEDLVFATKQELIESL